MSQQPEQQSVIERAHNEEQEIAQSAEEPHQESENIASNAQKLKILDLANNEPVLQKQDSIQQELDKRAAAAKLLPKPSENNPCRVSILINGEVVQQSNDNSTIQPPEKYETKSCSVNLNICSEETKEISDIPRSISSHSPIQSSEGLSVTASPSSELSGSAQMLSYMNKQQSRRDMKNWMHGRSLGGFTVRSSLPENKVTSYDQIETPKKLSNLAEQDSSFASEHEEVSVSSKFVKYGESFCSPARTIGSSKSKKIIKISNSISSELRQQDFKDDEMIEVDESAYQAIVKNYDIAKNISVSIKSLISNPANDSNANDPKKITIPVLISVKTADQVMSFSSLKGTEEEEDDEESQSQQENILNRLSHLGINQIALEEGSSSSGEYHEDDEEVVCEGIEGIQNLVAKIEEKVHKQEQSDDIEEENESEEDQEEKGKEERIDNQLQAVNLVQREEQESPNRKTSVEEDCSKEEESKNKQTFIPNTLVFEEEQDNVVLHKAKNSLFKAESLQSSSTQPQTQSPVAQRFPIDLICVIDTSGSMNGEPLALVKETLLFLIELLQNGDRICLIQFSTNARRLTPLLSISKKGNRELMREEIQKLIAKGGTNINQGMQVAFDVLKQRRFKNAITSVFLLSDGLNDGAEHRIQDLLKMMNFYQNYSEVSFTIQTFGFGKDHDPALMDKISQLMDGNFYYIEDIHRLDECFIDALGGLFSVVSQNVDIRIRVPKNAREKVSIVKTFGQIWNVELESYEYRININQLLSGVSKDYVLELEIDPNILLSMINEKKQDVIADTKNDSNQGNDGQTQEQQKVIPSWEDIAHNILEIELTASSIRLKAEKTPKIFSSNKPENVSKQLPQNFEIGGANTIDQIPKETEGQVHQEKNIEQLQKQQQQENNQNKIIQHSEKTEHLDELSSQHSADKSIEESEIDCASEEYIQKVVKVTKLDLSANSLNDKEVQLHYLRVKGAEGLERCQTLAVAKKFDEGSQLVKKLLAELKASPPETLAQLSKLVGDLKEAADALKKKVGEQIGWHRMISCKRMHMEQRSAGTDLAYQNSVQKLMVQKRQTFKNQLLNPNHLSQIHKEQQFLSPIQPFDQLTNETYFVDHVKDTENETAENNQNEASFQSPKQELEHHNH